MAQGIPNTIWDVIEKLVVQENGCFTWPGRLHLGYGRVSLFNRVRNVHIYVYEHFRGKVPDGLELDHLCRNPPCANPWHLEAVPHAENLRRGANTNRDKTHCKRGHEYAGKNLYINPRGGRDCRACRNAGARNARDKKRARLLANLCEGGVGIRTATSYCGKVHGIGPGYSTLTFCGCSAAPSDWEIHSDKPEPITCPNCLKWMESRPDNVLIALTTPEESE